MVIISGERMDNSALANLYPAGSFEAQLLSIMSSGSEKYRYDTLEQLKFELKMRKETVNAALALHNSGMSFAVFHKSKCNPDYWDRMPNGGFKLAADADPASALEDIFLNGYKYATECATAMVIVYYKAMLNVFGADAFNRLFPKMILMNWHSINPLLKEIGMIHKTQDFLYGSRGYFKNPDVDPQTPEWQGENVIILPDELYYGHGIGIKNAQGIIEALNKNRKKNATRSAYFLDSVSQPDYKKLADVYESTSQRVSLVWREFPPPISTQRAALT